MSLKLERGYKQWSRVRAAQGASEMLPASMQPTGQRHGAGERGARNFTNHKITDPHTYAYTTHLHITYRTNHSGCTLVRAPRAATRLLTGHLASRTALPRRSR